MHFVLLGTHTPDLCPTASSKIRELMFQTGPNIPKIAESTGVKIVAGPFVNHEHTTVVVVEAATAEDIDRFIVETRLNQWNSIRILPSQPMGEAIAQMQEQPVLF